MISTRAWPELLRSVVARADRDGRLTDMVWERSEVAFDRWASKRLSKDAGAVMGYEHACRAVFEWAKRADMATVYGLLAPQHDYVQQIIDSEIESFPELDSSYHRHARALQSRRSERRRMEWDLADVAIVNSRFSLESYRNRGYDVTKACVVPLGCPPVSEDALGKPADHKVRFIWAGTFAVHKGAHVLLEAWKLASPPAGVTLDVYGKMSIPKRLLQSLPGSIAFHGVVSHGELTWRYAEADVLVFPTLFDGFGMVVTEALAAGLPVVTTDHAGAADLIEEGRNGFVVPAGDVEALASRLDWCLNHPAELRNMRKAALDTARGWQWPDSRKAFLRELEAGLKRAGRL